MFAEPVILTQPADEIVVTGHALPDAEAEKGYGIVRIDRDALALSPSARLDSILATVPGVQLFRRSDSSSGHPTGQGVTLRALGGNASSRALLVLDGVPQSDPFGGWINWPAFDPAALDEVRVIRGGGSLAHGPGALAGTIDLRSRSQPGSEAAIDIGSRRSLAGNAYFGGVIGSGLLTATVQAARSDGFIPVTSRTRGPIDQESPYRQASSRVRWILPIAQDTELQASGLVFLDERERGLPFTGNRTRGADLSLRLVGSSAWRWSATIFRQWRNFRSSFASADEDRATADRVALQDSVPSGGHGGSVEVRPPLGLGLEMRLGADFRRTDGETNEMFRYIAGSATRKRTAGGKTSTYGAFAEATLKLDRLALSGGVRIDRWTISDGRLEEQVIEDGQVLRDDSYENRHGWRPTARAAAVYDAGNGLKLRSALYQGWRLASLNELFRPFRAGADATAANAELRPERLSGIEAGLDFRRGPMTLGATVFANKLSDAIANVTLGQGPGIFPGVGFVAGTYRQRRNLDSIKVAGLEAWGMVAHGPLQFQLSAARYSARIGSTGIGAELDGLRPAQTPEFSLSGEARWTNDRATAVLAVDHSGGRFEDDRNLLHLPAATTFRALLAWPIAKNAELIARGENLFDARVVAGRDEEIVERGTPRTFWLGLRIRQ